VSPTAAVRVGDTVCATVWSPPSIYITKLLPPRVEAVSGDYRVPGLSTMPLRVYSPTFAPFSQSSKMEREAMNPGPLPGYVWLEAGAVKPRGLAPLRCLSFPLLDVCLTGRY
jgi:hypothetical protein